MCAAVLVEIVGGFLNRIEGDPVPPEGCLTLFACDKKEPSPDNIPEGYYSGIFIYSGDTLFDAIIFKADTFMEVPSGGALHQKFPCLVEGTGKQHYLMKMVASIH